jgi:hypothetical protein
VIPCTPHPGLGVVVVRQTQVDLATCAQHHVAAASTPSDGVTSRARPGSQTILFKGKVVLTIKERHTSNGMLPGPLFVDGLTPDEKWIFYAIDPYGSSSYAADGVTTRAIRVTGGRSFVVSRGIGGSDYRAWCGGKLVVTAGTNRIATEHKWLIATGPPSWRATRLVAAVGRAFGSMVCSPDGKSIVVQSQPISTNAYFFATHWALWRVGLGGSMTQLTHPPAHHADESPHFAADGTLYFVRSIKGVGKLYALRRGKLVGPLLSLGYQLGYYGHQLWPYTVTR